MANIKKNDLCEITAEDLRNKEARSSNTREHHEKARASGSIYFIGGLQDPALKVWGQND